MFGPVSCASYFRLTFCLRHVFSAILVHVVGFAPGTAPGPDASDGVADFPLMYGIEPKKKRLKEQDLFENNSQISSIDFLQPRPVSTGLGLSLDNTRMASTGDSPLVSLIGQDVDLELQRQDEDIEKFLKVQVWITILF